MSFLEPLWRALRRKSGAGCGHERADFFAVFPPVRAFNPRVGVHPGRLHFVNACSYVQRVQAAGEDHRFRGKPDQLAADRPVVRLAGGAAGAGCRIVGVGDESFDVRGKPFNELLERFEVTRADDEALDENHFRAEEPDALDFADRDVAVKLDHGDVELAAKGEDGVRGMQVGDQHAFRARLDRADDARGIVFADVFAVNRETKRESEPFDAFFDKKFCLGKIMDAGDLNDVVHGRESSKREGKGRGGSGAEIRSLKPAYRGAASERSRETFPPSIAVHNKPLYRGRMIRLGLCCIFRDQPIRFRQATATALLRLEPKDRRGKLADLCRANAVSLRASLEYCTAHGIGAFRINSQILPLKTHPVVGYELGDLPGGGEIIRSFEECGAFARKHQVRTSFHPDQFVLLNSPRPDVVISSVAELEYQAEVAEWVGADVINIHGGGAYGDKKSALARMRDNLGLLSKRVRARLTLENDDRIYTPADLFPVCRAEKIPLCYDAHHHRCLPDGMTVEAATRKALKTWNREPLFHLSSPIEGWKGRNPFRHHDFINPRDFPPCWRRLDITIEVEAKAKELAVERLRAYLVKRKVKVWDDGNPNPGIWEAT